MIDKELDIKDLNIGKVYRYKERDFGCTMFIEVLIRNLSFKNDAYKVECEVLRDLGSNPKLDMDIAHEDNKLELGYQKDAEHYFKGVFYNAVEINNDISNDEYDAEIQPLAGWDVVANLKVDGVIYGCIYNDKRGRFNDGEFVHTSTILEYNEETKIATTKNTKYKIIE